MVRKKELQIYPLGNKKKGRTKGCEIAMGTKGELMIRLASAGLVG